MSKILFYDLETCFIKPGMKRGCTKILEIGIHAKDIVYQKMINPLEKYSNGDELIKELISKEQDPDKTIQFWTKLLIEKGAIKTNIKRTSILKKAEEISTLLKRSDIAITKKNPKEWLFALETFDDDLQKSEQFIKTKKAGKPKSLLFYKTKNCLQEIVKYSNYIWVAHNGKSFDEKIVRGNAQQFKDVDISSIQFQDSLPVFRRLLKNEVSYSLPLLYKSVLGKTYKAHHAYEDAKALGKLFLHVTDGEKEIFKTKSDLLEIKGIGKKTVEVLAKKNIKCTRDLYAYVETHTLDDWHKDFCDIYRYKSLGSSLFNSAVV